MMWQQHHRARSITATSAKQIKLSRRSRVVCSSSQRFNSSSQQRPDKLLPPPNALATDAPRTASSPPPPSETGSSDRSYETDYVVIGSGIGGGWGGTRQCQPLCQPLWQSWHDCCHSNPCSSPGARLTTSNTCFVYAGLCCGALLARYGYKVTVVESHYLPGAVAVTATIRQVTQLSQLCFHSEAGGCVLVLFP